MKRTARPGELLAACLSAALACLLLSACQTAPAATEAREWYEIGNGWYDQGKWDKAGKAYSRAIALDPSLKAASYNLSRALAEAGDYDGALEAIEGVISADPSNVRALSAKAYILYRKGDAPAALRVYDEVLRLDPYAPDAIYNATLLRDASGDHAGAIAGIEPLAKAKADDAGIQLLYARVLAKGGRTEDAIAAYVVAGGLGKLTAEDNRLLGDLYAETRSFSKAIDAYQAAVAANPRDAVAWFALARLKLGEADDGKGGLEALKKALEAGFADAGAAEALLAEPVLAEREAVTAALKEKGLVQ